MSCNLKLNALLFTVVLVLPVLFIHGIVAQSSGSGESASVIRQTDQGTSDKPSGRVYIRLGDVNGSGSAGGLLPSENTANAPAEPGGPGSEDDGDPPEFFGEPLEGRFVWVLDVSLSMQASDVGSWENSEGNTVTNATRIQIVKFETIKVLKELKETDYFDFVLLAGANVNSHGNVKSKPVTDVWKGELVACDDATKAIAIQYVKNMTLWWGTPTHKALQRATNEYGHEIDKLLFLTDGAPYPPGSGEWGNNHKAAILQDFPGWYAPLKSYGCELFCFHIGNNQAAGTFMQDFASQNGGEYIKP